MPARPRSSASLRYRFDESNRLIVPQGDRAAEGLRPVRVVEGTVTTDRRNRLIYRVETPTASNGHPGPRRYNLDGTWALTNRHELKLALHETTRKRRQTLYLRGAIAEAKAHALTFALWRYGLDGRRTTQRLSLRGRWQADRRNRLTFLVEKADGAEDRLTFRSGWTVDRHHQILYRYRQRTGKRRTSATQTLRFAGVWDITRANRLVYRVDGSTDSTFDLRASIQTPSLNPRDGRLVYQVGIGLSRGRTDRQRVVLFGTWKLNRDLSVSFEVPYANRRRQAIRFKAAYALAGGSEVAVTLLDRRGRPLGMAVTFTKRFLGDAKLFLRLRKAGEDAEALAGVQLRF